MGLGTNPFPGEEILVRFPLPGKGIGADLGDGVVSMDLCRSIVADPPDSRQGRYPDYPT
jgi:hypothetical protein